MGQVLYFLPRVRKEQCDSVAHLRALLKERGLTTVFADVAQEEMTINEVSGRGPGDLSGTILTYQTPSGQIPRRIGYEPSEQEWTPVADGSQVWLGIDTAEPPSASELQRKRQYTGYPIELGDGGRWLIPVIRRPDDSTELPTDMKWDATGTLIEPIKPAYRKYWDECGEILKWHEAEWQNVPRARALELAVQAVSLNYRFDRSEQNLLALIDGTNLAAVLYASIGWTDAEALLQKKMAQIPTVSTPGSAASTQPTDQPVTSCT